MFRILLHASFNDICVNNCCFTCCETILYDLAALFLPFGQDVVASWHKIVNCTLFSIEKSFSLLSLWFGFNVALFPLAGPPGHARCKRETETKKKKAVRNSSDVSVGHVSSKRCLYLRSGPRCRWRWWPLPGWWRRRSADEPVGPAFGPRPRLRSEDCVWTGNTQKQINSIKINELSKLKQSFQEYPKTCFIMKLAILEGMTFGILPTNTQTGENMMAFLQVVDKETAQTPWACSVWSTVYVHSDFYTFNYVQVQKKMATPQTSSGESCKVKCTQKWIPRLLWWNCLFQADSSWLMEDCDSKSQLVGVAESAAAWRGCISVLCCMYIAVCTLQRWR